MRKVLIIGELCEDILLHNTYSIEVMGKKMWTEDITSTAGGSAAYAAGVLAHLGNDARLCSTVGQDDTARFLLRLLEQGGVDCSLVAAAPDCATTRSVCVCNSGEKQFIGWTPVLPITLPADDAIRDIDLVYIAGYMMFPEFWTDEAHAWLRRLRDRGVAVALDAQLGQNYDDGVTDTSMGEHALTRGRLDRVLPLSDLFFAARKEISQLYGGVAPEEAGRRLLAAGCGAAVLKQGKDGVLVMDGGGTARDPEYPVEVYDTIGSGDMFGGAYCHAWLQGWDAARCAAFANVFTSLSITRYQGVRNFPSAAQVEAIIANR